MRNFKFIFTMFLITVYSCSWSIPKVNGQDADPNKQILRDAVVGAGVGAVASGASGGNTGKGALIGAGTNVIGNAVLNTLTSSPSPAPQQVQYVQQSSERPRRGGCSRN